MDQAEFSRRFKNSPVKRAKRRGLLRNVAVALGNWGSVEAVPVLAAALSDEEPLIRGHAAWALGRIGGDGAVEALRGQFEVEADASVREEIEVALSDAVRRRRATPSPEVHERVSRERSDGGRAAFGRVRRRRGALAAAFGSWTPHH